MLKKLNQLLDVPFEQWSVKLRAVSANADGIVNSGITKEGIYFYRKWASDFTSSEFVLG